MRVLKFDSSQPPSVNHYNSYRVVTKGQGKFKRNIVMTYPSKEYVAFKKEFVPYLMSLVKAEHWDMIDKSKHYYLDVVMFFKNKGSDSQNYFKCPSDVGNGILWEDDSILITRAMRVYYTKSDEVLPHFEYTLYEVPYIGIFNHQIEYDIFVEKCNTCRWYREGLCSRLQSYLSYTITNDFDWKKRECKKYKMRISKE